MLFQKNIEDETPFATACIKYGLKTVVKVIEKCLSDCSDKPNIFSEAFLSAAINEGIHLDCVYFLLRRDPDMLQKLLSASPATNTDGEALETKTKTQQHRRHGRRWQNI
jgi:hypothetical protein